MKKEFNRWSSIGKSTWAFQTLRTYSIELEKMRIAHSVSSKFCYQQLGKLGANWEDQPKSFFTTSGAKEAEYFDSMKAWKEGHHELQNWMNLNSVMAMSSNFETYLSAVVSLAIASDPGAIVGAPHSADGIYLLKHGKNKIDPSEYVIACTKGDWNSRVKAFEDIFGLLPKKLKDNVSELNSIRRLRNNVGHSFGRDLVKSRINGLKNILPTERITEERTTKYQRLLISTAKSIDKQLLENHIGEFQILNVYHDMFPTLRHDLHLGIRAMELKKKIGQSKAPPVPKDFAKDLVKYYEEL